MFGIAAILYVATLTGRRPVFDRDQFPSTKHADDIFNLSAIGRVEEKRCPCHSTSKEINMERTTLAWRTWVSRDTSRNQRAPSYCTISTKAGCTRATSRRHCDVSSRSALRCRASPRRSSSRTCPPVGPSASRRVGVHARHGDQSHQ